MQKHLWRTVTVATLLMISALALTALAQEKRFDAAAADSSADRMMPGCAMKAGMGGKCCARHEEMRVCGKRGCCVHADMKAGGKKDGKKGRCMKDGRKGCCAHGDMKCCCMKDGRKGCCARADMKGRCMRSARKGCCARADIMGRCLPGGASKGMEGGSREGEVEPD
jgi:hypothetical protein